MRIQSTALGLTLVLTSVRLLAQPGAIDPSFNPTDTGFDNGAGANSDVHSLLVQPDGKILLGGNFSIYNGSFRGHIARVNTDGSWDSSFAAGEGANTDVLCMGIQVDGKVLIGGSFTYYDDISRNRIARLNADGSLDTGFDPGTGANSSIRSIAIQPDGKILIGGSFTSYNGTPYTRIARLNPDGSLDTGFNPGSGAQAWIETIALQPDGKILIVGAFTSYNGVQRRRIARLNSDGSLDPGFNPGMGANLLVDAAAVQADGRILIGGDFTDYNGILRNRIARLNSDGSLDTGFNPGTGVNGSVYCITLRSDGKILIGGNFISYNGATRNHIARLNPDGSLDNGLNPGVGPGSMVYAVAVQPAGQILIGGDFTDYNGIVCNHIARAHTDGSLDSGFNPSTGAYGTPLSLVLQPDGRILIAGGITSFNGIARNCIARANADGSLDAGFNPGTGANGAIHCTTLQPDGKILIGGQFTTYNGADRSRIARVNADGSLDAGFNPGTGTNSNSVLSIAVQPDGKILIGGGFASYNGIPRNNIARLNSDGSLDTGFDPGSGPSAYLRSIVLQPDGKILIGGGFTSYNGTARNRIARLNPDGSLDNGFDPGTGANNDVYQIALQPNGKTTISGSFTSYNSFGRNRIARLNSDGSLDPGFNPGTGANDRIEGMTLQPDGKVLLVGIFTTYNGTARYRIARVNSDGSLDTAFNPGTGPDGTFDCLALQADGKLLIGGDFTSYNGTGRNRIARLEGDPSIAVHIKVHLEGAYSATTGLMSDALRMAGLVPLVEPYTALGYSFTGGGSESTSAPVLAVSGNDAIVDWAVVELRSDAVPATVLASKSALLQRDGDVVAMDGIAPVRFAQPAGTYRIAIRHRNHLGAMTLNGVALSSTPASVDFTTGGTTTYGTNARKSISGTFPAMALWAGDVTFNGQLKYIGAGNDRDPILVRIGGSNPANTVAGYWNEDVNLDGLVRYVGNANDRDPILINIGGSIPTNTRAAQLP